MGYRPETANPLNELAEVLLSRSPHPLTPRERELIAAYVSGLNLGSFCCASHSAFAAARTARRDGAGAAGTGAPEAATVSPKLRALLHFAAAVQRGGRTVTGELAEEARTEGATDVEIHDTVLIAAAFCMFNRYVDGLRTQTGDAYYEENARRILTSGYGV
jgi:AhpD family alkylhydroperoxidase